MSKSIVNCLFFILIGCSGAFAFGPNAKPTAPSSGAWGVVKTSKTKSLAPSDESSSDSGDNERRARSVKTMPLTRQRTFMSELRATAVDEDISTKRPIRIIIAGAPASGKGTQCEVIKEKYGVVHLSTGDMLRAAVAAKTDVGLAAKAYMDAGKLVPDEVIIGVVNDRLAAEDCQKCGWLLDGFPRTETQARALAAAGIEADCFLFLNVPDTVLVERVVGRRSDPETGKIYHLKFSPPPDGDTALLERLVHRSDDTEEKVKVRLEQFHANVDAVKGSYTDIAVSIDGNQAPAKVSDSIFEAIEEKVGNVAV